MVAVVRSEQGQWQRCLKLRISLKSLQELRSIRKGKQFNHVMTSDQSAAQGLGGLVLNVSSNALYVSTKAMS